MDKLQIQFLKNREEWKDFMRELERDVHEINHRKPHTIDKNGECTCTRCNS